MVAAMRGLDSECTCGCSVSQSCPALCDPMDCNLSGSSAPGILQARMLEWVAMPSSRGSSPSRDGTHVSCISCIADGFLTAEPAAKPGFRAGSRNVEMS